GAAAVQGSLWLGLLAMPLIYAARVPWARRREDEMKASPPRQPVTYQLDAPVANPRFAWPTPAGGARDAVHDAAEPRNEKNADPTRQRDDDATGQLADLLATCADPESEPASAAQVVERAGILSELVDDLVAGEL